MFTLSNNLQNREFERFKMLHRFSRFSNTVVDDCSKDR